MNCPKCGHPRAPEVVMCSGCGIYFSKWEAAQRRLAEPAAVSPAPSAKDTTVAAETDDWSRYWARCAAVLLIAGFLLPLFKRSMLAGESFIVWPWQLAGLGQNPGVAMALSTYSEGAHPGIWTLVPLVTACLVFLVGRMAKGGLQTLAYTLMGLTSLILLLLVFIKENERLGLVFTPPTPGAGIVTMVAIAAGALIAAANHASRMQPEATGPARWAGAGGIVLVGLALLFMVGGGGPWKAWSMWGLYGLVSIYALLASARLFREAPALASINRLSVVGRLLVAWSVIAVIVAQSTQLDGFSVYVVQGGGSTAGTVVAAVKSFLIFFGSALVMAVGIAAALAGRSKG